jgi:hypothetical protein
MKKLNLLLLIVLSNTSFGQWVTENIDNGIDIPYPIAYCMSTSDRGILKLEENRGEIAFYVTGSYFCSDNPIVDIGIKVNGETNRYRLVGRKSRDSKTVFLIDNLLENERANFVRDFKNASSLIMRVNEEHCTDEYFAFIMRGSTKAFNFMLNSTAY